MGQTSKLKYICDFDCGKAINNAKQFAGQLEKISKDAAITGAKLTAALTPLAYISKKATQQAGEYARSIKKIRVATGETGAALNALADNFKAVRKAIPQGDELVAQTLGTVNQKFSVTGKALETVTKAMLDFSRMTGTDATNSVTSVAKAMNNWKIQAKDTTAFLDKVYTASTKTGASAESIATYMASMGAQFRNLNLNLDQSIALIAAFQKAGISVNSIAFPMTKAIGEMSKAGIKDVSAGFADLIKKIKEAGSAAEANALGKKFFGGRGYMQITTAIREGRFELNDLIKTLQNSSGSFNKAAQDTLTFSDRLQRFKNNTANALEPLGLALVKIADEYMPKLQKITTAFAESLSADKLKIAAYSGSILAIGLAATKTITGLNSMLKSMAAIKIFLASNPEVLGLMLGTASVGVLGKKAYDEYKDIKTYNQKKDYIRKYEPNWSEYVGRRGEGETVEQAYKRIRAKNEAQAAALAPKVQSIDSLNPFKGTGTTDFSQILNSGKKSTVDYASKITKLKDEIDRLNNSSNFDAIIGQMDKYAAKLNELDNISTKGTKANYAAWQSKKEYTAKFSQELSAAISDINLALEKNDISINNAYSSLAQLGERYKLSSTDAYALEKALRSLREQMQENTQSILDMDREAAKFSQENMLNKWANQYNAETAFGGAASIKTARSYLALLEQTWASLDRGSAAWVQMGEKIREVQNATLGVNLKIINEELNNLTNRMQGLTGEFAVKFSKAVADACVGTANFKDSLVSMLKEMGAAVVEATTLYTIMSLFTGGSFGKQVGGYFNYVLKAAGLKMHTGGIVGRDGAVVTMPANVWNNAPKLHTGNLRADEYPAILQKGETVIPKNANFGTATECAGTENHYHITIQAVDSKSFTDMLTRNNGGIESLIVNSLNRGGALRSAVRGATA